MNERELRELDIQVHKALYPDATYVKAGLNDGSALSYYVGYVDRGEVVGYPLPRYSTDIGAWETVCKLKPAWLWQVSDYGGGVTGPVEGALVTLHYGVGDKEVFAIGHGCGLSAWAHGMARCVIRVGSGEG